MCELVVVKHLRASENIIRERRSRELYRKNSEYVQGMKRRHSYVSDNFDTIVLIHMFAVQQLLRAS